MAAPCPSPATDSRPERHVGARGQVSAAPGRLQSESKAFNTEHTEHTEHTEEYRKSQLNPARKVGAVRWMGFAVPE
jgi:hypothetical protein